MNEIPLSVTLMRKAHALFEGSSFRRGFNPTHYAALLRLAIGLERNQPYLTPARIAETCFISERHAREILGELTSWGLTIKRRTGFGSGFEYALDVQNTLYACGETQFERTPQVDEEGRQ